MENVPEEQLKKEEDAEESKERIKVMERQSITLLVILMLVLAGFVAVYFLLKPKPYFEYENLRIYPVSYGNMMFYSIPLNFKVLDEDFQSNIILRTNPVDIENLSYSVNSSMFGMARIGFTMDPELSSRAFIAAQETGKLSQTLGIPTFYGVTKENEKGVEILDCSNSTENFRIVRMEIGNETKVFSDNYCIIIQGENYDEMTMASDKLAFEWIKAMRK